MSLPIRHQTHITESESRKILSQKAPKSWLIRELTERDYGVDAYIEICSKKNEVTGDFFLAQLKGTETAVEWVDDPTPGEPRYFTFSGTKISTVNYWMRLGVPVFLLVVDCDTKRMFFANVKEQVRSRYNEFLQQSSFGFRMIQTAELGPEGGHTFLEAEYLLETNYSEFNSKAITLLSNWQNFLKFIEANSDLDSHMEVDPEDELHFVHIYQTTNFLASWMGIEWNIPPLKKLYQEEATMFGNTHALHNCSLDKVLPALEKKVIEALKKLFELVMVREGIYWERQKPIVFRLCSHFWLNKHAYPLIFSGAS